jgi:hypothetical protein
MQLKRNKTGNVRTDVTLKGVRVTTVAVEEQYVLNILSVCVSVDLVTQYQMRMRHIVICGLSGSTIIYFST